MGYLEGKDIVSVIGRATIETEFVSATFSVIVKQRESDGPSAKSKAAPIIEKILHTIREHGRIAEVDTSVIQTTLKTRTVHDRQTDAPNGYECIYTIKFTAKAVDKATVLHDALTSIAGADADTPVFNLSNTEDIERRAFAEAVRDARTRFESQCQALGVDPKDYIVTSWKPDDRQEHHGKTLGLARDDEGARPIGLSPGRALYELQVTVWFSRNPK